MLKKSLLFLIILCAFLSILYSYYILPKFITMSLRIFKYKKLTLANIKKWLDLLVLSWFLFQIWCLVVTAIKVLFML